MRGKNDCFCNGLLQCLVCQTFPIIQFFFTAVGGTRTYMVFEATRAHTFSLFGLLFFVASRLEGKCSLYDEEII